MHLVDGSDEQWRVAVNVESRQAPSELLYLVEDDFHHPVTAALAGLAAGWHRLAPGADGPHIDYVRGNLFDRARMRLLAPTIEGPDNDLADLLEHWLGRAVTDPAATVFAFGQSWGPDAGVTDDVFGFEPARGVHDIHMNQGSAAPFDRDNGVRQDGALIVRFPQPERWLAIFLAFQSQAFHTDDVTGDALDATGAAAADNAAVRIARRWSTRPGRRRRPRACCCSTRRRGPST